MFDQLGLDLADVLAPWIAILISLSAVFWFKDFAVNLMSGLKFKFNPAFNEGDHIILDGEDAIIVRIGFRETVFGVYSEKGYVWRYISNDRLKLHKLEKIINKENANLVNNFIHPDQVLKAIEKNLDMKNGGFLPSPKFMYFPFF